MHEELYRVTGIDFTKIPGLDILTVQTIISEVGVNYNKWRSEKHFTSWLGLSPANKITGEKVFSTRTRKSLIVPRMHFEWLLIVYQEAIAE